LPTSADSARRERAICLTVAVAVVFLRSFVATFYEGFYFDSDQAIVGLMARHLSRFHHFPLFYYSLNYILAVQAWIIAPFFVVGRSSVALMRLPMVVLNAAVVVALISLLISQLRLRPAIAFVAALPFVIPSAGATNQLLEVAGACVEPIGYVLALWWLRRKPVAFGVLLAVGYFHREFTIFALPAVLVADWRDMRVRRVASMLGGFAAVWLIVGLLKIAIASGTGGIGLQVASLRGQMCLDWPSIRANWQALVTEALPALYGLEPLPLNALRMTTDVVAGSFFVGKIVWLGLALMLGRLAWRRAMPAFGTYLIIAGTLTACAYPLSCQVMLHAPPLFRYLLLTLVIPVGIAGSYFASERSIAWRSVGIGVLVFWAGANLSDNVRLLRTTVANPPVSEHRILADYLIAHRIRYARAIYWDAYMVDFLSRERVITASTDIIRIPEYQDEVEAHAADAVMLQRLPCSGSERVASWCIQR